MRPGITLLNRPPECVEIILCQERTSDGEAARHD